MELLNTFCITSAHDGKDFSQTTENLLEVFTKMMTGRVQFKESLKP